MPPPVTPSPHRFIAGSEPTKASQQARSHPPQSQARTPVKRDAATPSQQFKPTPRFSISRSRPTAPSPLSSTIQPAPLDVPSQSPRSAVEAESIRPSRGPRPKLSRVESIQDSSQEDGEDTNNDGQDEVMLFDLPADQFTPLVESVESQHDPWGLGRTEQRPATNVSVPSGEQPAKRRRLTPNPDLAPRQDASAAYIDPAKTAHGVADLESPPRSTKTPRFRIPGQTPVPTSTTPMDPPSTQTASTRSRNPFLLRPPQSGVVGNDPEGITPLPEHFSPHRRSQKFVPGGMADVVRTWLLNVGHGGLQTGATSGQSNQRADQSSNFRVTECFEGRPGDRLRLVSGRRIACSDPSVDPSVESSPSTRAILVGPAKGNPRSIKAGDCVAVAPPSWEVEVGQHEERWLVAVDWNMT